MRASRERDLQSAHAEPAASARKADINYHRHKKALATPHSALLEGAFESESS
jgi:hypothetical protein